MPRLRLIVSIFALFVALPLLATHDVLISEYVEGTSNNKAIELYNPTASAINLSTGQYRLEYFFNGSGTAGTTITLTGSIPAGGVYVIAQSL
ncbi:MAG TPA: lamin tail domain-containing protein, partial [Thermoanaerobaculia bacterium]|nr:lamin tail domain-containing protein [Thermoanaerobaculia bacterium]